MAEKASSAPANWKQVVGIYGGCAAEIQQYFEHLPKLIEMFPWEVSLSYLFTRIEQAHTMILYCGVVKLHHAHAGLASTAVDGQHMTRDDFKVFFEKIFGRAIIGTILEKLEDAALVRDRVLHGKTVPDEEQRNAIAQVLAYAQELNKFVEGLSGFKPFGDLRGFKGRGEALDMATTRWMLKGIGFDLG